jgi:uncharacterized membrane protein
MKATLIVLSVLIALVAVVLLIGTLLPSKHVASRQIVLRAPLRDVYATLRDFASAPTWRTDLKAIAMLESVDGRVRFREDSSNGAVTYEVIEELPGAKLVTRIVDRDLGYFGSWTYDLEPAENGTRVRITEDGEVPNVVFRFMARFVFGHTASMDTYLKALGRKFGEEVTPK